MNDDANTAREPEADVAKVLEAESSLASRRIPSCSECKRPHLKTNGPPGLEDAMTLRDRASARR